MAEDLVVNLQKPLEEVETSQIVPKDLYTCEFIAATKKHAQEDYIEFKAQVFDNAGKKLTVVYDNISLAVQSEWMLKKVLIALGASSPKGTKVNVTKMLFRKFLGDIGIEQYTSQKEGEVGKEKKRNVINDYFPVATKKKEEEPSAKKEEEKKAQEKEEEEVGFDN